MPHKERSPLYQVPQDFRPLVAVQGVPFGEHLHSFDHIDDPASFPVDCLIKPVNFAELLATCEQRDLTGKAFQSDLSGQFETSEERRMQRRS